MNKYIFANYVKSFDFKGLFNGLGWDNYSRQIPVAVAEEIYQINGIVEKRGFVIVLCPPSTNGEIPLAQTRKKIEHHFSKYHQEHLLIYHDINQTKQVWQFVVREPDKPRKTREVQYAIEQDAEILYQRARGLLFTLDEEENITLIDVVTRFEEHFAQNTETVTKRFYTEFKKQHDSFLNFIAGIDDLLEDQENKNKQWYASLMLNRLMFCYFIQKRGYLDNNFHYLRDKLKEVKTNAGNNKFFSFYRDFLLELFHKGLGQPEKYRHLSVEIGKIPYLNGGLFDVHELERQFQQIEIKDDAFENIFEFFDQWNWHLDSNVKADGRNINPDVIGYIFEKYINDRAAMGAYYTKEDITDYIGKNTIIPFLFDQVKRVYPKAFGNESWIWNFLKQSGDTYIYDAVKKGIPEKIDLYEDLFADLPDEIKAGFLPELEKEICHEIAPDSNKKHLWEIRKCWNQKAPEEIALPTETFRELIERRKRYAEIKAKIESEPYNGGITEINDFITFNLNIRQFTQDILEHIPDADFIRHFYKALQSVTILDPTCGSGAFLFAAMNILEPFYETCIERMEQFTAEEPRKYKFFHEILAEANSAEHPNLAYFIYKTIILNNLYGVDIMHEAVEIAKLRLFLKIVGAVDIDLRKPNLGLEPLPDIDFNIRAGNTLVGFASEDDFKTAVHKKEPIFASEIIPEFEDEFAITATAFKAFQDSQLNIDAGEQTHKIAKQNLQQRLDLLNEKLNIYLADSYGINDPQRQKIEYAEWLETHQPFHWLAEFYGIIKGNGGFDVVIGNPPYVEYSKVKKEYQIKNFNTIECGNLYAFVFEISVLLSKKDGKIGLIVPISLVCTKRMENLLTLLSNNLDFFWNSCYAERPSKLFNGAEVLLTISIMNKNHIHKNNVFMTGLRKWNSENRSNLFDTTTYTYIEKQFRKYLIPKYSTNTEVDIGNKMFYGRSKIESIFCSRKSDSKIYYRIGGGRYWKIFLNFQPRFILNDIESISSRENHLFFNEPELRDASISILSSSLFFMYFIVTTNGRDLNPYDLNEFPVDFISMKKKNINSLSKLNKILMIDYRTNSKTKNKVSKITGNIEYEEYYPKYSKPIIDSIDTILAEHYCFSEDELDFIINYDIKYRMGTELRAYTDGTLAKRK